MYDGSPRFRLTVRNGNLLVSLLTLLCCGAWGCVREAGMDQQVSRIGQLILEAEGRGALRCAPRELAVARSQLQFAELERSQGFSSKAEEHLRIADRHAQAARLLSPPEHCQAVAPGQADGPTL
jgi:OmpA-OmpF porin, OOP family